MKNLPPIILIFIFVVLACGRFTQKEEFAEKTPPHPAPAASASPEPEPRIGEILNDKAESLPKPVYPQAAKAVRAKGEVNVAVEVDENGNVSSASATSGHPLLRASAEQAAKRAKFKPSKEKLKGVIVYNFNAE